MTTQASQVRLTQPWDKRLGNPYRTRWAQVGDRRYMVSADWLRGMWTVDQVDIHGEPLRTADAVVAVTFNLAEARVAIAAHADGQSEDEIFAAVTAVPRQTRSSRSARRRGPA